MCLYIPYTQSKRYLLWSAEACQDFAKLIPHSLGSQSIHHVLGTAELYISTIILYTFSYILKSLLYSVGAE